MKKNIILIICTLFAAVLLAACSKNVPNVNPDADENKHLISQTTAGDKDDKTASDNSNSGAVAVTDKPEATPAATVTPAGENGNDKPVDEIVYPSVTPEVTEAANEPTPTPEPETEGKTEDTDDGRREYWDITYLTWLPTFEGGKFLKHSAADTFDYVTFTNVSRAEADKYIEKLQNAGFSVVIESGDAGGELHFLAENSKEWIAEVDFLGEELRIGSGFYDYEEEEQSEDAGRTAAFTDTLLAYVPYISAGEFASVEEDNSDGKWNYAVLTDVSEQDARDYVEALKGIGYIYGADEGDMDGVIWYMAVNQDNLNCYMAFSDGIMRVGCGYYDED